ncbi:hypothetical protein EYF80_061022 [Liparis tanakae]|uniref:Uncharacterized protein n=1 Tax=Liparis tanakae TaxID=230148 RepID=A0A4Z2EJS2_9TELE|nr:hypothetical protein EYF80_061022 [Liparis tanakae]
MRRDRQLSGSRGPLGGPAWSLWVEMWPPKKPSAVQHVQLCEAVRVREAPGGPGDPSGSWWLLETRNEEGHVRLSAGIKGGVDRSARSLEV